MDDKKHLTDCHFYSLGSCTKGDSCVFRHLHTPTTIATTTICKLWRAEVCEDVECALRHPTLPRAIDGSLITCLYDLSCAKRDQCPYAHSQKFEPKPSIPGLSGEDQPRLQITLAPPSSEPRFVAKPTNPSTVANRTTETATSAVDPTSSTKKTEDTEPPAKKQRPDLSRFGLLSKTSRQESATQQSDAKPQTVSFVKSFQEILKQREQDEKEKTPVDTKPTPAPLKTDVKPKPAPAKAAGRGEKRKAAEPTPKQEPKAKAAPTKAAKLNDTQSVKQSVLARVGKAKPTPAKAASVTKAAVTKTAEATAAPKAPPSFGIKSLGELMKEREDPATSAAASVSDKPPAKTITANPSVGNKRKLEQLEKKPVPTTAAPKPKPKPAPTTTTKPATTTTPTTTTTPATTVAPTTKPQEESFDDLEKELEELGVDLDAEEVADEDVDIEIDLGV